MSEETIEVTEETLTENSKPLVDSVRRILLASVGAVVLAQEEVESFLNKLVERGEIADKDARQVLNDVVENQKQLVSNTTKRANLPSINVDVDRRMENVLNRLNLPTRTEVNQLSVQISALSEKVDELSKQTEA